MEKRNKTRTGVLNRFFEQTGKGKNYISRVARGEKRKPLGKGKVVAKPNGPNKIPVCSFAVGWMIVAENQTVISRS